MCGQENLLNSLTLRCFLFAQFADALSRPLCNFFIQIATHAAELPTGKDFGAKKHPSVFRMIGMSATVRRADTEKR